MIKKCIKLLMICLFFQISSEAASPVSVYSDSSLLINKIRITLMDNRTIRGEILAYDSFSLTVRPFSRKDGDKRIMYPIEILTFDQIKSVKILRWGLYLLMIVAGTGLTVLTILVTKGGNNLLSSLDIVLIGPLLILAGLIGIFSQKKFKIDGKKDLYLQFIRKLTMGFRPDIKKR
jgi:hypothetical protein